MRASCIALLLAVAPAFAARAQSSADTENVLRVDLLDNGDFGDVEVAVRDARGLRPLPWWRSSGGLDQVLELAPGRHALRTKSGEWAEQPIAAYAPLAEHLEIVGKVSGRGRVSVTDGSGDAVHADVGAESSTPSAFTVRLDDFARLHGHAPMPRFTLRLEPQPESPLATWSDVHAIVALPCPDEKALRGEILDVLHKIIEPWLTRSLDDIGPRKTAFLCHEIDAKTGRALNTLPGGFNQLYEQLNDALPFADDATWRAALERFFDDFLALGVSADTGLPRLWDPAKDEPMLDTPLEIALPWSFLIDIAERGPEKLRERARAAAERIGETVLAHGLLADGNVAASYYPDGRANPNVSELRRFDVLAQLARTSALVGDARFADATSEAFATFEFTHHWSGTWEAVDPAFDDEYGHYGARAATIARAVPKDKLFRRFVIEGFEHFSPLWRDAVRLGGNVAADQVRCWSIACDVARLEPSLAPRIRGLLHSAARAHFKGEQYSDGAWGDVTIFGFGPKRVEVGDYTGSPQNLLSGLASIYGALDLPKDEVRAMYTAVLRSSVDRYLRPYGFLMELPEHADRNSARGTLRMLLGLVKMLRAS
jgi:hypothetical protein